MGKHDHLISYVPKPDNPNEAASLGSKRKIAWMERSFMPGAPYFEIMWYFKTTEPGPQPHTHDFDEVFGFIGGDPDNPTELNGIVKFKIEDEWYTFTKSVLLYVPAGMLHSPIQFVAVEKPIIHFSGGQANTGYSQDKN